VVHRSLGKALSKVFKCLEEAIFGEWGMVRVLTSGEIIEFLVIYQEKAT
jgi:hypothetical protein